MKTKTATLNLKKTNEIIKQLRTMHAKLVGKNGCGNKFFMSIKSHKNKYGITVYDDNPVDDMLGKLVKISKTDKTFNLALSGALLDASIYTKHMTIDFLVNELSYWKNEYDNGDESAWNMAGFGEAISNVINNQASKYFFISTDDDNLDDNVHGLNMGTLDGVFHNIFYYYNICTKYPKELKFQLDT